MSLNVMIYASLFVVGAAVPPLVAWLVFVAPYGGVGGSEVKSSILTFVAGLVVGTLGLFGYLWFWAAQWGRD